MNASLQIHDLLDTWTRHEVKQLKIGPFTMDDAAIQKSFRLPVWVKENAARMPTARSTKRRCGKT